MAKKQAAAKGPIVVKPAPPSYFDKSRVFSPPVEEPTVTTISGKDVAAELKVYGKGYDDEAETLLNLPERLFRMEVGGSKYFSKDQNFNFSSAAADAAAGKLSLSDDAYGISISFPSSTAYFTLVDMRRRIIVRERLVAMHEEPPQKDWAAVKKAIKDSAALASSPEAKKAGLIAVFDGYLRAVSPKKA